jgi:hypothetical protein
MPYTQPCQDKAEIKSSTYPGFDAFPILRVTEIKVLVAHISEHHTCTNEKLKKKKLLV